MKFGNVFGIKSLTSAYIIALSAVAVLSIVSTILLVFDIKKQESNSRVINISGRQRMLSQNLTKNILLISTTKDNQIIKRSMGQLAENTPAFILANQALQVGDPKLEIPPPELSLVNSENFKNIAPHFTFIVHMAQAVLSVGENIEPEQIDIEALLFHESAFLTLMDQITFEFDRIANSEINQLLRFEILILIITLLTLLIEAFFIFKPIISFATKQLDDNVVMNRQLLRAIEQKEQKDIELADEQRNTVIKMVLAEESERKRIATELHESAGQDLTSVKINLILAEDRLAAQQTEDAIKLIKQVQLSVDAITDEIRTISYDLIPPSLAKFGLIAALEEAITKFNQKNSALSARLVLHVSSLYKQVDYRIELLLYRIVQEIITLFSKTPDKSTITLHLSQSASGVELIFESSDGTLFAEESFIEIKPKINLLRGAMAVTDSISGTKLFIKIPLQTDYEKN